MKKKRKKGIEKTVKRPYHGSKGKGRESGRGHRRGSSDAENAVRATDGRAEYDECAKRLLGNRSPRRGQREFTGSDYGDIQRVYSIWICMNQPENGITRYRLERSDLFGIIRLEG